MRFSKKVIKQETIKQSDGMGGSTNTTIDVFVFSAHVASLPQELVIATYGYNSNTDFRLFTKQKGLKNGDTLKIDGSIHKIIRIISYGHISSMIVRKST